MDMKPSEPVVTLDVKYPIWDLFFTVAPLVIIGTREGDHYDLAPKHMVAPIGWEHFGFVCTPEHATYHNAKRAGVFTASFPRPSQVVLTSLTAAPRCDATGSKPILDVLPTFPAQVVDGVFVQDAYLFLECELEQVLDDFGPTSLLIGRIVAAHVQEAYLRSIDRDDQDLLYQDPLLAYVSPGRYALVDHTYAFPFPAPLPGGDH